jgi:hypothetical protein
LTTYYTPLATYPTGYYAPMFVLAEATTRLLDLTPYQNTYAYRAWTVVAAGLLWLLVYRALLVTPGVWPHASLVLAFLLLNPMLAFVSSSVSPDSVNVPLATLGILLTYRTLMTGRHGWQATLALLACALTKPSILLIFAALPIPALLLWRSGAIPVGHLAAGGIAVARAAVISYCVHYAWSPPRFAGSNPVRVALDAYVTEFPSRLPGIWIQYWGRLGWTDYELAAWWYTAMFGVALVGAIVAAMRMTDDARRFAALRRAPRPRLFRVHDDWRIPEPARGRLQLSGPASAAGLHRVRRIGDIQEPRHPMDRRRIRRVDECHADARVDRAVFRRRLGCVPRVMALGPGPGL